MVQMRLQNTGSEGSQRLMSQWLDAFVFGHDNCSFAAFANSWAPSESFSLPRRIIDVGSADRSQESKLMISKGLSGKWAALNHCCGAGSARPLDTRTTTIEERIRRIPMSSLPTKFSPCGSGDAKCWTAISLDKFALDTAR